MTSLQPRPDMSSEEVHSLSAILEEMPLDELLRWWLPSRDEVEEEPWSRLLTLR